MTLLPTRLLIALALSGAALLATACGPEAQSNDETAGDPRPSNENTVGEAMLAEPTGDPTPEPGTEEGEPAEEIAAASLPSSEPWAALLTTFRTDDGFRYAALHGDAESRARLDAYVAAIGTVDDLDTFSRDERLAFLINAYNAITVKSVIDHWPIESVMRVEGFFDAETHTVAGEEMTLNVLENENIRGEEYAEPRIHFAVNCASVGCPPLRAAPYAAATLDADLEEQSVAFVRASSVVSGRRATVSKIFEWFADDFAAGGGVRPFLAARLEGDAAEALSTDRTRLRFADYDWDVNAAE